MGFIHCIVLLGTGYPAIVPPPGYPVPNNTIQWMNHFYSEFIQYPTHHNAGGVLWKNTWDNLGRAEDAITPLIDHVEDEFQRDDTFLEDVCVRLFKTLLEHFPAEDYLYWVFGYAVGQASKLAMKHWEEHVTTTALEAMHFQRTSLPKCEGCRDDSPYPSYGGWYS